MQPGQGLPGSPCQHASSSSHTCRPSFHHHVQEHDAHGTDVLPDPLDCELLALAEVELEDSQLDAELSPALPELGGGGGGGADPDPDWLSADPDADADGPGDPDRLADGLGDGDADALRDADRLAEGDPDRLADGLGDGDADALRDADRLPKATRTDWPTD